MDADEDLLRRLRAGDEEAFVMLVGRYHQPLLRLARSYVPSTQVAEEVVQDTWVGVLRGLEAFESRSSLQTWLFRILVNRAQATGTHERRSVPVDPEPAVEPSRFDRSGQWAEPPAPWTDAVDDRLRAGPLIETIQAALDELPGRQAQVVLLHDVQGLSGPETCAVLGITEGNQRILLHRGRSRLRQVLETKFGEVR